jgi:tRNA modification GTPase
MTAFAVLSAPGTAALASIGLIGSQAPGLLATLFRPTGRQPWRPDDRRPRLGRISADGINDEVILRPAGAPERLWWEVTALGSPAVVDWLGDVLERQGAQRLDLDAWWRLTEPTWYRAELAHLLLRAPSVRTARLLHVQYATVFESALVRLGSLPDASSRLACLKNWLQWRSFAEHMVVPWRVVLAGPPNVGKSSLLNALTGYRRAVADPTPGTTRDLVTAPVLLSGWPVELIDTAGERPSSDPIEIAGQAKAREVRQQADLVLWLRDSAAACSPPTPPEPATVLAGKTLTVWTKIDLHPAPAGELAVSAVTGAGMERLRSVIAETLVPKLPPPDTPLAASAALMQGLVQAAGLEAEATASLAVPGSELDRAGCSPGV